MAESAGNTARLQLRERFEVNVERAEKLFADHNRLADSLKSAVEAILPIMDLEDQRKACEILHGKRIIWDAQPLSVYIERWKREERELADEERLLQRQLAQLEAQAEQLEQLYEQENSACKEVEQDRDEVQATLDQLLAFFSNDNFLTYGLPSPAAAAAHSPAVREESMRRRSVLKDNMLSLFRSPSAAASTNTAASRKRVTIVEPSPASPIAASSLAHTPSSSAAITPSRPAPPRPTLQVTTSTTPLHTGSNVRPAVEVATPTSRTMAAPSPLRQVDSPAPTTPVANRSAWLPTPLAQLAASLPAALLGQRTPSTPKDDNSRPLHIVAGHAAPAPYTHDHQSHPTSPITPSAPPAFSREAEPATPAHSHQFAARASGLDTNTTPTTPRSRGVLHVFRDYTSKNPSQSCHQCSEKIGLGCKFSKCSVCQLICHYECQARCPRECGVLALGSPGARRLARQDINLVAACGPDRLVPQLMTTCLQNIEEKFLHQPNLYRTLPEYQGRALDLLGRFLKGSKVNWGVRDACELCNCVLRFLYQLDEPLLTNELLKDFIHAVSEQREGAARLDAVAGVLGLLPRHNFYTLQHFIRHLQKVMAHAAHNGANTDLLAHELAPLFIRDNNAYNGLPTEADLEVVVCLLNMTQRHWTQAEQLLERRRRNSATATSSPAAKRFSLFGW